MNILSHISKTWTHKPREWTPQKQVPPGAPGEASRCRRWQQSESISLPYSLWKQRESGKGESNGRIWNRRVGVHGAEADSRAAGPPGIIEEHRETKGTQLVNSGDVVARRKRRKRRALGERESRALVHMAEANWLLSSALLDTVDETWSFQLCHEGCF